MYFTNDGTVISVFVAVAKHKISKMSLDKSDFIIETLDGISILSNSES